MGLPLSRGNPSTMNGGLEGELGTENVCPKVWGGVRGVGGLSTMIILSLRCCLVGLSAGASRFDARRRIPVPFLSSEDTDEDWRRWFDPPEDRGGVCGNARR